MLWFIFDKNLIPAYDLIILSQGQMTFLTIKIALEGCRIMFMMNRENQFNKKVGEIPLILANIKEWFEQNESVIPKAELFFKDILKKVIAESDNLFT